MAASSILTLFTACILISTVQASELATSTPPDDDLKTGLNSSCIPIVLRMTYCLDFLFTGSTLPTPTDQCCLRLKFTTELDFPCIWDFFKSGRWGHHKLNHTRAESLASTCGIIPFPFPLPPIPFTSQEVQPALMSESLVPGPSGQETTDPVDEEQVEAPESSTAKPKLPRLLLG